MKKFSFLLLLFVVACKKQTITECVFTNEYNPVCAGDNQYPNPCTAKCDGYKDSQISILLAEEQIAAGMMVSVDCSI